MFGLLGVIVILLVIQIFKKKGNSKFSELSKKYWDDVRSGKRKKWTDTKVYDKATKKWIDKKEEPKKEEPKPEIKLEKKTPDKETEEIKKEIKETPIDKIEEIVLSKEEKKKNQKEIRNLIYHYQCLVCLAL